MKSTAAMKHGAWFSCVLVVLWSTTSSAQQNAIAEDTSATMAPNENATRIRQRISNRQMVEMYRRWCRNQPKPDPDQIYCPAVLDKLLLCWNHTLAGTTAKMACPPRRGFDAKKTAEKECLSDGTWYLKPGLNASEGNYTNYLPCVLNAGIEHAPIVYIVGYSVSIIALMISLVIFFHFKQLACDRVTLHKNLFICYMFNGATWIIYYSFVFTATILPLNPWYCQVVFVFATYFGTASYFWMFSEGLYLLTILVVAFHKGNMLKIICICVGWGVPAVLTIIYSIVRGTIGKTERCWSDPSDFHYITLGPVLVTLCVNFIIVLVIFALLMTKLRSANTPDQRQGRKAAKAILILVPLLGVQNIVTLYQPDGNMKVVHHYISAVLVSFQGLFVAILLCYCNEEVITVMRRRFGQHRLMHNNSLTHHGTANYTTNDVTPNCNTAV